MNNVQNETIGLAKLRTVNGLSQIQRWNSPVVKQQGLTDEDTPKNGWKSLDEREPLPGGWRSYAGREERRRGCASCLSAPPLSVYTQAHLMQFYPESVFNKPLMSCCYKPVFWVALHFESCIIIQVGLTRGWVMAAGFWRGFIWKSKSSNSAERPVVKVLHSRCYLTTSINIT